MKNGSKNIMIVRSEQVTEDKPEMAKEGWSK
jgi:hypothetical protein